MKRPVYNYIYIHIYIYYSPMSIPVAARSKATCLLILWVRIPSGVWMFFCCECCLLLGCLCDELITRLEESYGLWYVVVCDLETS
jgi:hypothetical protein